MLYVYVCVRVSLCVHSHVNDTEKRKNAFLYHVEFSQGLILPRRESQQSTTSTVSTTSTPRQNSLSTSKAASRPSGEFLCNRNHTHMHV